MYQRPVTNVSETRDKVSETRDKVSETRDNEMRDRGYIIDRGVNQDIKEAGCQGPGIRNKGGANIMEVMSQTGELRSPKCRDQEIKDILIGNQRLMHGEQKSEAKYLDCLVCDHKLKSREQTETNQRPVVMTSVATITDIKGLANSHVPEFSRKNSFIPKRYVMAWKQDMVNRKLILRNAELAGTYKGPHEESLFLENKERLCHGEERKTVMEKISQPQMQITHFPLHSPLSKYKSYMTSQRSRMLGPCY